MRINPSELTQWRSAARPPSMQGKPRTKAGREWLRLTESVAEAVAVLDALQRDHGELDSRLLETEERLRGALANRDLALDPNERKAAADVAVELEAELEKLQRPRDFDREADVASRVCRQRVRELNEYLQAHVSELLNGEVVPIAHEAHDRLQAWLDAGPTAQISDYRRAETLALPLLLALGLNGQDLPMFDLSPISSEIERLQSRGVPYPLPRSFFDADGEPLESEAA